MVGVEVVQGVGDKRSRERVHGVKVWMVRSVVGVGYHLAASEVFERCGGP